MRYYELTITDSTGASLVPNEQGSFVRGTGATFTSYAGNVPIPGALNIEFDVPVTPYHMVQGKGVIRIWGVGLAMIGQATNLNGMSFTLRAGMGPNGLPLANPVQRGVILRGQIFQAFGNWQGPNQSLDLIVYPGGFDAIQGNVQFFWQLGTPLASALDAAFKQAFQRYKRSIAVSALNAPYDVVGTYDYLSQFATWLNGWTATYGAQILGNDSYQGVTISCDGQTIFAFDGTTSLGPTVQLAFADLIGQPTWIGPNEINFKTVLRADVQVGQKVRFPTGVVTPYVLTATAAGYPNVPARSKTVFQNDFVIREVHYFANLRQPDADSWNTTFVAASVGVAA